MHQADPAGRQRECHTGAHECAFAGLDHDIFGGGEVRGTLLPIPEPETYALMLAGLGAVSLVARKRRQKGA